MAVVLLYAFKPIVSALMRTYHLRAQEPSQPNHCAERWIRFRFIQFRLGVRPTWLSQGLIARVQIQYNLPVERVVIVFALHHVFDHPYRQLWLWMKVVAHLYKQQNQGFDNLDTKHTRQSFVART